MRIISKSNFELGLKYPKKFLFTNVKTYVSKNSDDSFFKSLFFGVAMLLFFASCEDNSINKEIERLQSIEKELIKSISQNDINHAKVLCVEMKWGYVATTAGADAKCKKLAEIWDDKRRNYFKIIGVDPEEILGEKPKPKTIKEKLIESY